MYLLRHDEIVCFRIAHTSYLNTGKPGNLGFFHFIFRKGEICSKKGEICSPKNMEKIVNVVPINSLKQICDWMDNHVRSAKLLKLSPASPFFIWKNGIFDWEINWKKSVILYFTCSGFPVLGQQNYLLCWHFTNLSQVYYHYSSNKSQLTEQIVVIGDSMSRCYIRQGLPLADCFISSS